MPLETAVRLLAKMANLKPVRVGNVLFITGKETATEMRNDPDLAQPPQPLPVLKDKSGERRLHSLLPPAVPMQEKPYGRRL